MQYMGSKNRISKELKPIIESYITDTTEAYIEPFVGGANMIDKIDFYNKIGFDLHENLIYLLNYIKHDFTVIPNSISKEEYDNVKKFKDNNIFPKWYVGLVGFCASFGSKYFGGYARAKKGDNNPKRVEQAIRNLEKQRKNLKDIEFKHANYLDLSFVNSLIYCDIPYKNTTKYKTGDFDYEKFYNWCVEQAKLGNTVLVSEYNIEHPNFKEIWRKEIDTRINNNNNNKNRERVEKLYLVELKEDENFSEFHYW